MDTRMNPVSESLDQPVDGSSTGLGRRAFVALSALALASCAAPTNTGTGNSNAKTALAPVNPPKPTVAPAPPFPGTVARARWSHGEPVAKLMNPMVPVKWITIHHDGMTPFTTSDMALTASRIELIRNGHRGKGWGDIGYHFIIDRSGRIWEGRALKWQGAHVKDHNEGNIGIVCLGNFEVQSPSDAQLKALERHIEVVMRLYKIPATRIKTHREWVGAKTACPGKNLQKFVVTARSKRQFA